MPKKFQINQTKIKGSCQSRRKVVPHVSKSDLALVVFFEKGEHSSYKQKSDYVRHLLYRDAISSFLPSSIRLNQKGIHEEATRQKKRLLVLFQLVGHNSH